MPEEITRPGTPAPVAGFVRAIEGVGRSVIRVLEELGGIASLGVDVGRWSVRPPYRWANFFAQLDFVGVGSIFIVCLTGMFSGMVFALQSARAFEMFDAESLVGPTVAL